MGFFGRAQSVTLALPSCPCRLQSNCSRWSITGSAGQGGWDAYGANAAYDGRFDEERE